MNLQIKKIFAASCGISTSSLSVYIARKKVIVLSDGMIDCDDPRNKFFIEKQQGRLSDDENIIIKDKTKTIALQQGLNLPNSTQNITESERQLKYLDTIKRSKEIEKLHFEINNIKSEVVPSGLILPVFVNHNANILTEFSVLIEDIIKVLVKRRSLTASEINEIKQTLLDNIITVTEKTIIISEKRIETIISEFTEKRAPGEHATQ